MGEHLLDRGPTKVTEMECVCAWGEVAVSRLVGGKRGETHIEADNRSRKEG